MIKGSRRIKRAHGPCGLHQGVSVGMGVAPRCLIGCWYAHATTLGGSVFRNTTSEACRQRLLGEQIQSVLVPVPVPVPVPDVSLFHRRGKYSY
jgi:hypothetical protein